MKPESNYDLSGFIQHFEEKKTKGHLSLKAADLGDFDQPR